MFPFSRACLKSRATREREIEGKQKTPIHPMLPNPSFTGPLVAKRLLLTGGAAVQEIGGHLAFAFDLDQPAALQLITFG